MSDAKVDFNKSLEQDAELEKIKKETNAKRTIIDSKRIGFQMDQLTQNEKDLQIARSTSFGALSFEAIQKLQQENADYIANAKNSMRFIVEEFDAIIPFFRKNLILIGGVTGHGKSTTVANIVYATLKQINPETGKRRRSLVITNEERSEDVYNRLTCLSKGWHYTNHDKFTPEQVAAFNTGIAAFAKDGMVTVIDNNYNGSFGLTTTIEGIQSIFDGLIRDKEWYDVIIIDYYQNVKSSKQDMMLDEFKVQAILAKMLDQYKNIYPAPIVLLAQVKAQEEDKNVPFEYRIKGRKVIVDVATHIMEMNADRENLRTSWTIHKSRFNESIGNTVFTGYDQGKFVDYTKEFTDKVAKIHEKRQKDSFDKGIGITSEIADKENK